jgi:hypothetical protein
MKHNLPDQWFRRLLTGLLLVVVVQAPAIVLGDGIGSIERTISSDGPVAKSTRDLPREEIIVIPAAAFRSDGMTTGSVFFPFSGGYFQGGSENYGCMVAPVYLPDEASVVDVFASVFDNDASRGITVTLRRVDNFAGGTDTMATASTTAAGVFNGLQVISDGTIDFPVVRHPAYSYYLTTCLGSQDIRLYSVRLYLDVIFIDDFETGNTAGWSSTTP